jgi:hypothetical protein
MGLRLERVPEEDEEVNLSICDLGPYLLITT